ncbi:MAG: hypothetical protein K2J82_09015 [Muribaculaceae bacterium]|nr:hypothetical protein [Muribaculaceae bacterium]MDE6754734.1 hypothetical protein [Muribaculaceae bacterium]
MTQIIVTLENSANPTLIQKIFENIKGVVTTSVRLLPSDKSNLPEVSSDLIETPNKNSHLTADKREWLDRLNALCSNVNTSVIDENDENLSAFQ